MAKLTKTIREYIAKKAIEDLFIPTLLEQFDIVNQRVAALVKEQFKDFDWKHVKPYENYILWDNDVTIQEIPVEWVISRSSFRRLFKLPVLTLFFLPFKVPRLNSHCAVYLDSRYQAQFENIVQPYMEQYQNAEKAYNNIQEILPSFNTFRQVIDEVPELAKYLPSSGRVDVPSVSGDLISSVREVLQNKKETE